MCNPLWLPNLQSYIISSKIWVFFILIRCFTLFIWMADTFLSSSSHSGQHPTNSPLQCSGCTQRNLKGVSTIQRSLGFSRVDCVQRGCIIKIAISPADAVWRKKSALVTLSKGAWEQSVCVCLTWLIILLQLHSTPSACLDMFGGMSMKGFKCSP